MNYFAGVDLGGTFIKCGIFNENCELLEKNSVPTDVEGGADKIITDMANLIKELCKKIGIEGVCCVGIGSPGIIDSENGIVAVANNLKFDNVAICNKLTMILKVPSFVSNDANIAALGEYAAGSGKDFDSMVLIALGTGIGGGFIQNGKIFEGYRSAGAEFGHQVIKMGGRKCACGRKGCFEAYASASALVKDAVEMAKKHKESLINKLCNGNLDKVNGKIFFEAVSKKDIYAKKVLKKYINSLAEGIVNVVNLFRPQAIIIGGGISAQKDLLIKPLEKLVKKQIVISEQYASLSILSAKLENDAGIYGAAKLSIQKFCK